MYACHLQASLVEEVYRLVPTKGLHCWVPRGVVVQNLLFNDGLSRAMKSMSRERTSADSAMESADMAEMFEVVRSIICALRSPAEKASVPRSLSVGDSEAAALSVDMPGVVRTAGDDGACKQQCTHCHTTSGPPVPDQRGLWKGVAASAEYCALHHLALPSVLQMPRASLRNYPYTIIWPVSAIDDQRAQVQEAQPCPPQHSTSSCQSVFICSSSQARHQRRE